MRLPTILCLPLLLLPGCQRAEGPRTEAVAPSPAAAAPVTTPAPATTVVAPPGEEAMVMRTYEVPGLRAAELAAVLQRVLRTTQEQPPRGRVTAMNEGRVVVVAPAGIHEGVERLCNELTETDNAPPKTVQLSLWLVFAEPADSADASDIPEIREALDEVSAATEPLRFTLGEHVTLSSLINAEAKTQGRLGRYEQVATAYGRGIVADLEIDLFEYRNSMRTRVTLQPGQTVVVGQSGLVKQIEPPGTPPDERRILYVVRAELADAQ